MRLADVPPSRGGRWFALGWRTFGKRPLAFSGLFAFFVFAALTVMLVPWAGPLLMLAALPMLTLGFMIASRDVVNGRVPLPGVFVHPLFKASKAQRSSLIRLGLLYAISGILIMVLCDAIDGGRFDELQQLMVSDRVEDHARVQELLIDGRLRLAFIARITLLTLVSVPFWHAPALIHWAGQGVAQSLFSSTIAVWRCKGAFVVYSLAWVATIIAFGLGVGLLGVLTGSRGFGLLAVPAGLVFSTVFYTSLYFTYADSFIDEDAPVVDDGSSLR